MKLTRLMIAALAVTLLGGSQAMAARSSEPADKSAHALRQAPAKSAKPSTSAKSSASPATFIVGRGAVWLPKGKRR